MTFRARLDHDTNYNGTDFAERLAQAIDHHAYGL